MKFLSFMENGKTRIGVKTSKGIVNLNSISDSNRYNDMIAVINEKDVILKDIKNRIQSGEEFNYLQEDEITFGPAINPKKIICVGLNYRKHAEETNAAIPESPILFNKFNNGIAAHKQNITLPKTSSEVDYEAELGIVIGKETKEVNKEDALDHVFGYCAVNDLSARDLQMKTPQWMLGKISDGFCPVGPYLVTTDEVGDPNNLSIKSYVNGEVKQNSNTSDMIFNCKEIVSYISQYMTLEPGDLIITGTPEGVVLGLPKEDRVWLQENDEVIIEIEKLGSLVNKMVADK
ncbi:fumarylacetoacetate hydrolase family protein [Virgibacillus sp. W0430]|uniref:fumarylacetoacetate hydrolase family protein n=1 Tax=Virgibacillus sp. W0430 TaxID=3391580 RepID=UPI003F475284